MLQPPSAFSFIMIVVKLSPAKSTVWHLHPKCCSTVWACWRRKMVQPDQVTEVEAGGILALYLPSINMMEIMNAWILSQVRFITTFIIGHNMFLSHRGSAGKPPWSALCDRGRLHFSDFKRREQIINSPWLFPSALCCQFSAKINSGSAEAGA